MSGHNRWSRRQAAGVLLLAACLCASFRAHGDTPAADRAARADDAVVVLAAGIVTMEAGLTVEEAHHRALADARRNALNQAVVDLEAERAVVDRRLAESIVRVHAMGRVRQLNVEEAGLVEGADPPVYRVLVRALVAPRPAAPGLTGAPAACWVPRLALAVSTSEEGAVGGARLDALKRGLAACGVHVVPASSSLPHLIAEVTVAAHSAGGNDWTRIGWLVADPADPSLEAAIAPVSGVWQIAGQVAPDSPEWGRLSVRLAQDSLRAWMLPREASLQLIGMAKEDAEAMVQVLRRSASSRIERALDDATVEAELSVGGCPVAFCDALLQKAGIAGKYVAREASLTGVLYAPAVPEQAEEPTASEPAAD